MSVVDMHRVCRCSLLKVEGHEQSDVNGLQIVQFTDWICGDLRPWTHETQRKSGAKKGQLVRITCDDGNTNRVATMCQIKNGKSVGGAIAHNCFICRQFLTKMKEPPTGQRPFGAKSVTCPHATLTGLETMVAAKCLAWTNTVAMMTPSFSVTKSMQKG